MKRLALFSAAVTLLACGPMGGQFANTFPSAETVRLEVPSKGSSSLGSETGTQRQEVKGATSDFYRLTRGVTVGANAGVGAVLGLVKAISEYPPTSINGDVAVWGPHTEDLSPNTWKFTVTKVGPATWDYQFEGKAKQAPDTDFVVVLSGTHSPALDANGNPQEHFGEGDFLLDFDAAQTLPEHGPEVGKAQVSYSRLDAASDTVIDIEFDDILDGETQTLIDASYRYRKHPQQGGAFEFMLPKDVHANDPTPQPGLEKLTIKSRWTSNGAGRSDVKATGGELPMDAFASECWDENFNSQFLHANWAPFHGWGAESTDCAAFPSADYSQL